MDTRKTMMAIAFLFLVSLCGYSQQTLKELRIGDQIADLKLVNNSGDHLKLQHLYKDGLLIIDFWATWCVPCLSEMRFLDSLKREHPNKFNVLMVSNQDKATVNAFFNRTANADLKFQVSEIITGDTVLCKLFPHRGIPHNVWVDKNGTIKAITSGAEITEKNILGFSDSTAASFRVKKDNLTFRPEKTFHLGDSSFTYRSIISPYVEGIPSGESSPQSGAMSKYFQFNQTILRALWVAYSNFNPGMRLNLMEVHTADSSRFFIPERGNTRYLNKYKYKDRAEWDRSNLFCYALTLPKVVPDSVFTSYIFNDMKRQFNVKVNVEKREIPCMVVTKSAGESLNTVASDSNSLPEIRFAKDYKLVVRNSTIAELLDFLFRRLPPESIPHPFIDKTGSSAKIRFNADLDCLAEPELQTRGLTSKMIYNQLTQFGFNFNLQIESYPVLVISDQ